MTGSLIADYATADRIGFRAVEENAADSYRVFQYEHRPSRLTLYGVELVAGDDRWEVRQQSEPAVSGIVKDHA